MRLKTIGGLWIEGDDLPTFGPRPLALLALVASAGKKGVSRDRVVGTLWAEVGEEQARHTLSQTLYNIRREAGRELITGTTLLQLDPSLSSDIGELRAAAQRGDLEVVADLYVGKFLDGFFLPGAPEFERWAEEERRNLEREALRAIERLAKHADEAGDRPESVRWWGRLAELEPLSARYAAGHIRALAASGDRTGALTRARLHREVIHRELNAEPDPSILQLEQSIRAVAEASVSTPAAVRTPDPVEPSLSGSQAEPARSPRPRLLPWLVLAVLLLAVALRFVLRPGNGSAEVPFLAVGDIRTQGDDTTRLSPVLRDMLATSLGAIEGLQVVANSRLVELLPKNSPAPPGATNDAARRAGATELIEGDLAFEGTSLVLSLRRVGLRNGVLRRGYVLRAADGYAVVDSAAAAIARDLGFREPSLTVAQIRTQSPVAYALYEEGLRAHYGFDDPAAYRLMTAALGHDSTFAMAAFYAWRLARAMSFPDSVQLPALDLVKRLMFRTVESERLMIQASVADVDAPLHVKVALTDTLSVKFPDDPDVQLLLGGVREGQGDWPGAIVAYERAFTLDSVAGALAGSSCRFCHAFVGMVRTYLWADSAEAAIRVARRLIALQPDHEPHRRAMVEPLLRLGRRAEAEEALQRGGGPQAGLSGLMDRDLLRWGRYEEADQSLSRNALSLDRTARADGWWLLLLSLRDQGRLREADTLIHQQRIPNTNQRLPLPGPAPLDYAMLGMEMGQPSQSILALRVNAGAHSRSRVLPAWRARNMAWNLALAGTAYAAAGDTVTVLRLADSVEAIGRQSHWARDLRLHHMLRGLIHQIGGRHEQAVAAFERSLFSLTDGYTRTNLMMARSLLELRRPAEAVAVLRPAIRGGVDGGNTYVSRTELREALALAFEMAGQADSARAHWREVESAWRRADPQFRERYLTAKAKAGL